MSLTDDYRNGSRYGTEWQAPSFQHMNDLVGTVVQAEDDSADAKTKATTAESTASAANTKSDNAVNTASEANTKSDNAVTTANSANTKADNAITTANTATTTANEAKTESETAINKIIVDADTIDKGGIGDKTYELQLKLKDGSTISAGEFTAPQGPQGDAGDLDTELSTTSTNAVQNKVITENLNYKVNKTVKVENLSLDMFWNTGFYDCKLCSGQPSETNGYGTLIVNEYSDINGYKDASQIWIPSGSDSKNPNSMWYRVRTAGVWKEWQKVPKSGDTINLNIAGSDTREENQPASYYQNYSESTGKPVLLYEFKHASTLGLSNFYNDYVTLITSCPWGDASGGLPIQIACGSAGINMSQMFIRVLRDDGTFGTWERIISSGWIASYIYDYLKKKVYPVGALWFTMASGVSPSYYIGGDWEELPGNYVLQTNPSWTSDEQATGSIDFFKVNAGLPNITGKFVSLRTWSFINPEGVFYSQSDEKGPGGSANTGREIVMDASRASGIYGSSSTVQPPAIKIHVWRRIS